MTEHDTAVVKLDTVRRSCGYCAMHDLCLPAGLTDSDMKKLDANVREKRPLDRGGMPFHQGESFTALYVVRTGSLKTFVEGHDGDLQVLGFHLPGDILGIGGLTGEHYPCSAQALERSSLCELPYTRLEAVISAVPAIQHQLMMVISRNVVAEQTHMVMMGKQQAQRRLAIFLRSLAFRQGRLSRDTAELTLSMSRHDIANYLGLVIETVSRMFSRMEEAGILAVNRKSVHILRPDLLNQLCGEESEIRYSSAG